MRRVVPGKSFLHQLLLWCLYAAFFAVQLHFRYAVVPSDPMAIQPELTSTGETKAQSASILNERDGAVKFQGHLNKRYFPTNCPLLAPSVILSEREGFVIATNYRRDIASPIIKRHYHIQDQRGPPFAA
ncbi:MAG: hypothetical protein J0I32_10010 [Sphingobacteriales bacterium]|nr:hypothetical protein [Sphingobacteriales bacterium]OJW00327.1 MAG: hypothetical protein BGO52_04390 [Sphingobacteriales bacterium 44-61]